MERRIRLTWSPKHGRPWCPGSTRPVRQPRPIATGWTGFFKVQGLLELIRQQAAEAGLESSTELPGALPAATDAQQRDDTNVRG
jgi:hypothetical protein